MLKVSHIIPFDGLGGVEVAARSMLPSISSNIDIRIQYIFENIEIQNNKIENKTTKN